MADADKQVTITLAAATEESFATRGAGDGESARIFTASFGKDPSFAASTDRCRPMKAVSPMETPR